jgi:hypothetical protein
MNRRQFLAMSTVALAGVKSFAQVAPSAASLTLDQKRTGPTVPHDFVGLSYETEQLTSPDFFSTQNIDLIALFRELAPSGTLRMGGNTSDFGYWKPTPEAPMPERQPAHPFGTVPHPDNPFPVTPEAVQRLRGFLDATGWSCIYGINLGTNVPSVAVDEAVAVAKILGPKLECFQIGNEADRYGINFRRDPKTWGPAAYYKEWRTFAEAIVARLPKVRLGLPDLAAKPDWFATVTEALEHDPLRRNVVTMTYHYYEDGPPSNPKMDIPHLLDANADVVKDASVVRDAAEKLGKTWRMTEGNTCWNGGKPGVSDVFAAALWSADYLLLHASMGCAGVNLHGGDSRQFAASMGGTLAGDELLLAQHKKLSEHPSPAYTPLAFYNGEYVAEPVSYGMRFAGAFAGATMIPVNFEAGGVNATAYAARDRRGKILLAIINKDAAGTVEVTVPAKVSAEVRWLKGPALDARSAEFGAKGEVTVVPLREDGKLRLVVPPGVGGLYSFE